MRWLTDECMGHIFVERLRSHAEDVTWIREFSPGMPDTDVLALSASKKRILISEDYGFGELVFARGQHAFGVVILQVSEFTGSRGEIAEQIIQKLKGIDAELEGNLTVRE